MTYKHFEPAQEIALVAEGFRRFLVHLQRQCGAPYMYEGDEFPAELLAHRDGTLPIFLMESAALWRKVDGRASARSAGVILEYCGDEESLTNVRAVGLRGMTAGMILPCMEHVLLSTGHENGYVLDPLFRKWVPSFTNGIALWRHRMEMQTAVAAAPDEDAGQIY